MSKIYNSITELVGNTPLIRINNLMKELNLKSEILVKVESFNPLSSAKDRVGLNMVMDAIDKGILNKDTTIIESTSGNTGVGLAFTCASMGYKLQIVMPETMSMERKKLMTALGAELVLTKGELGMKGAIDMANSLHEKNPNSILAGQFVNEANPDAHRKTTALEILRDTDNSLDYFVAGVGTGGTITGVGEVLKEKIKDVKIVAVEPDTSAVLSGKKAGPHSLQGIGAGFIPEILNVKILDEIIPVSKDDAYKYARLLAKKEGILTGITSGAALAAGVAIASREEGKRIVVLLPDTGERYLSTDLY